MKVPASMLHRCDVGENWHCEQELPFVISRILANFEEKGRTAEPLRLFLHSMSH